MWALATLVLAGPRLGAALQLERAHDHTVRKACSPWIFGSLMEGCRVDAKGCMIGGESTGANCIFAPGDCTNQVVLEAITLVGDDYFLAFSDFDAIRYSPRNPPPTLPFAFTPSEIYWRQHSGVASFKLCLGPAPAPTPAPTTAASTAFPFSTPPPDETTSTDPPPETSQFPSTTEFSEEVFPEPKSAPKTTSAPLTKEPLTEGFETTTPCEGSTCSLVGDPHIVNFDGSQVSLLAIESKLANAREDIGDGDFWLVKSQPISIQARCAQGEVNGQRGTVVKTLAVGGPLLENNVLTIGPLGTNISLNGDALHDDEGGLAFAFDHPELFALRQSDGGEVTLELKKEMAKISVMRFSGHLNLVITLPPLENQEGLCGNSNGIGGDDTIMLIKQRSDPRVSATESLLPPPRL